MKAKIYRNTSMLFTALCMFMLLCAYQTNAQTQPQTLTYDQSFNTAYPSWPTGWSASTPKSGWVMDTSSSNASYTPTAGEYGYPGASGGAMVDIANPDNGDTGTYTVTSASISTIGYDSITAIFGVRPTKNFEDSGSYIKGFYWSSNGGASWDSLAFKRSPNDSYWHLCNDSTPIPLPSEASQQDSIIFKWVAFIHSYTKSGAASGTYRFDDFIVAGDVSTGINTVSNKVSPISLYPNPASGFVTINNIIGKNYTVRIMDVTGKTLETINMTGTQNRIDVSNLDPGFYFAQINDTNSNAQLQVVKLVVVR